MAFTTNASVPSFGGTLLKLSHEAAATKCSMNLNLYLPPQAATQKVPVIFYLAGLTCTGDNGAEKGFFQATASQKGIAIVYPDTSPRGADVPDDAEGAWDFGSGAGFYVNATAAPFDVHYRMDEYITAELPAALFAAFTALDSARVSIMGHSMGGHGALTLFLRNPGMYKSVSAFAPIANPVNCPWGNKAFAGYLGDADKEAWKQYDASELVKAWDESKHGPFAALIDVGTGDNFYKQKQLLPENFAAAAKESGNDKSLTLRYQEGYDHSYYFIATFGADHINHAAKYLFA